MSQVVQMLMSGELYNPREVRNLIQCGVLVYHTSQMLGTLYQSLKCETICYLPKMKCLVSFQDQQHGSSETEDTETEPPQETLKTNQAIKQGSSADNRGKS